MVKTIRRKHINKKKDRQKQKQKQKTFKKLKCSPVQNKNLDENLKKYTCYSDSNLQLFKNTWNKYSNNKIPTNKPEEIWQFFKKELANKCYNELCWLNDKPLDKFENKELIVKEIFKPFSPKSWNTKPSEWLSSVDITRIMKQYEKSHRNYVFIGPSPIDFDNRKIFSTCVWEKLCKFDLKSYLNHTPKIDKIGIILNLDPHDKPGSHWVALFIDIKKQFIFYFDSNGDRAPKQVNALVKRIKQQGIELNIDFVYDSNKGFTHQYNDGQCGMYTLYFIIELLKENKTYNYFKTKRIKDKTMKNYRKKYYNVSD